MRNTRTVAALAATLGAAALLSASGADASTIFIDKNGYGAFANGQVTRTAGPSPNTFVTTPLGTTTAGVTLNNIQPSSTYLLDWFHNSGATGSDFTFTTDAAGNIASIGTNGSGYVMGTPGSVGTTTLTLNTQTLLWNANAGLTSGHNLNGVKAAAGPNPISVKALPGLVPLDQLFGNIASGEAVDFAFIVTDSNSAVAAPGSVGVVPQAEPFEFDDSSINVRHRTAKYTLSMVGGSSFAAPAFDYAASNLLGVGTGVVTFDLKQPVGSGGINVHAFDGFQLIETNMLLGSGANLPTSGGNDFLFRPTLRYDGASPYDGFYWNLIGGSTSGEAYAIVQGNIGGQQRTMRISAVIPEPASLGLLCTCVALLATPRRRRRA